MGQAPEGRAEPAFLLGPPIASVWLRASLSFLVRISAFQPGLGQLLWTAQAHDQSVQNASARLGMRSYGGITEPSACASGSTVAGGWEGGRNPSRGWP